MDRQNFNVRPTLTVPNEHKRFGHLMAVRPCGVIEREHEEHGVKPRLV